MPSRPIDAPDADPTNGAASTQEFDPSGMDRVAVEDARASTVSLPGSLSSSPPGPLPAAVDKEASRSASFVTRLTTGTGAFNILGRRKIYYAVSAFLVLASLLLILLRGFNYGIDFAGGTRLEFTPPAEQAISTTDVAGVVTDATGVPPDAVQTVGSRIQVSSSTLAPEQVTAAKDAIVAAYAPDGGVSDSAVSETWGGEISQRALIAVLVFLLAVGAFIWLRYERRVALGAVVSTVHDLIVTAGIYALVGFEVTPATVIGLLTILGFSLYDTVVVYDKVQENTKGLTSVTRRTYPEAANLAINQTLMRSINTSLIALLPVAGLLVAGVAILGSGTLKDLALIQLVGMIVGAYSSVFIAVPLAVDLKLRDPLIKAHTARVLAKRRGEGLLVDADGDPIGRTTPEPTRRRAGSRRTGSTALAASASADLAEVSAAGPAPRTPAGPPLTPGAPPKPGAKPARPAGKGRSAGTGARPSGKGTRPTGKRGR